LEERQDLFLPFLQPLLDAPRSRYQLRNFYDIERWSPRTYIAERLIPDVEESGTQKSPFLIVANLADQQRNDAPSRKKRGWASHIKALDMAHNVTHNLGFQAYGPTRMLMWMGDEEKRAVLPRTVHYRSKVAVAIDSAFHVEEIAGAAPSAKGAHREDALELESGKKVALRTEAENTSVPPNRRSEIKDTIMHASDISREWHAELQVLENGFKNHEFSQVVGGPPGPVPDIGKAGTRAKSKPKNTPEYDRLRMLRNILRGENKRIENANRILQRQEEIDKLDRQAHRERIDPQEQSQILEALDAKIKDYKDQLASMSTKEVNHMLFLDDDRRAFAMDPPLLMWDRRKAEPLTVQDDEFYPSQHLALLDFQPRLNITPMTMEQSMYFETIATLLMGAKGTTNLKHLNTIAPGAYEALVPKVPAIQDPRRGGRRDIDSVRARCLTLEMLRGLAIAWDKWLFKPDMNDLLTQVGVSHEEQGLMFRKTNRGMT